MSQVEDWKISIPSFDLFPAVPLTFDEMYWGDYWQIINKPASVVREVMIKLEKVMKMAVNKQKCEKDEADVLEELKARKHKQQEELGFTKERIIIQSPTQLPLPKSQGYTLKKKIPLTIMSCHH